MTKEQYIEELTLLLQGISQDEIESAIIYIEEYFDEVEDVDLVITQLGTPQKFSESIIGNTDNDSNQESTSSKNEDYQEADTTSQNATAKKSNRNLWLIILGVVTAPVSIPLLIAVLVLVLSLLLIVLCLMFAVMCLGFGGIVFILASFRVMLSAPLEAITIIFGGLALMGLSMMSFVFLYKLFTRFMELLSSGVQSLRKKDNYIRIK